jgi:ABC-type spermidine/putrescine transport system permease subunit I
MAARCVIPTNIGRVEIRKRRIAGIVSLLVAAGLAVALAVSRADPWWRLVLFLPFWVGALGTLQAWRGT